MRRASHAQEGCREPHHAGPFGSIELDVLLASAPGDRVAYPVAFPRWHVTPGQECAKKHDPNRSHLNSSRMHHVRITRRQAAKGASMTPVRCGIQPSWPCGMTRRALLIALR